MTLCELKTSSRAFNNFPQSVMNRINDVLTSQEIQVDMNRESKPSKGKKEDC